MIITIDGPSGTGKSTVAKRLAKALGFIHVDSGAIYRSLAWFLRDKKIDSTDVAGIEQQLENFVYHTENERFFVGETEVTAEIRTPEITKISSEISKYKIVRQKLYTIQRSYAHKNAVFEGRDLGSVVFPDADLKFYLTATSAIRAKRRFKELKQKFPDQTFTLKQVEKEIRERDYVDSTRKIAPLKCPADAKVLDTSHLTSDKVLKRAIKAYRKVIESRRSYCAPYMGLFYRIVIFIVYHFFRIFYRHKIYGLEHYFKGGAIIAPNHVSFYDPMIVPVSWPEEVNFLARSTLFHNRLLGHFLRKVGSHPIKRNAGNTEVIKRVEELLKNGKKVVLFPEGTRAKENVLQDIKPGIALIVVRTQSAIVPTYVAGTFEVFGRERRFPKLFGKTACVFGSAIHYEDYASMPKKQAMEEITKKLKSAMQELRTWYESGAKGSPP
ncbi:MAG: (d)CMP kinase [Candidatus Algichlamydia australiensis]|nr:(d)CMP kinase [Chlamydiales bacterium]